MKEEKLSLISGLIHEIKTEKFISELTIIEQEAMSTPRQELVQQARENIENADTRITALETRYALIEAE